MPWFGRKSEEERRQEEAAQTALQQQEADQQSSLQSLEGGGLPLQAQRRLADLRQHGGMFTSDLSVDEFLLVKQAGLRPITQVMGSSFYHVGWQRMPGMNWWSMQSQELEVVTAAFNEARRLALHRLGEEARLAGANAVVGVRIERSEYDWVSDTVEFNAIGTAVHDPRAAGDAVHITNLSGQDYWKLIQAGYEPLGVVAATSIFYVVASWLTQNAQSFWGTWRNQELRDFTQGLYVARHLAMRHVWQQARELQAGGIIGMRIEQREEEHEVEQGENNRRTDMVFTFHAIGTAIAPGAGKRVPVGMAVDLRDRSE